jgi:hypothetical protein
MAVRLRATAPMRHGCAEVRCFPRGTVEEPELRTVHVGNVPSDIKEDYLRFLFQDCGPITHIRNGG